MSLASTTPKALLQYAVGLLSLREYSRAQLRQRLLFKGATEDLADAILEQLIEQGLQSDQRYAESRVRVRGAKLGRRRLADELKQAGVSDENVSLAQEELAPERERAEQVRCRRFGVENPRDLKEKARQARFLASRGFDTETIYSVLRGQ